MLVKHYRPHQTRCYYWALSQTLDRCTFIYLFFYCPLFKHRVLRVPLRLSFTQLCVSACFHYHHYYYLIFSHDSFSLVSEEPVPH